MNYQQQIDNIMDWFDFGNVARTMALLDWRWGDPGEIPSEGKLRVAAREHLYRASQFEDDGYCGSGGFKAMKMHGVLSLAFELESWQPDKHSENVDVD